MKFANCRKTAFTVGVILSAMGASIDAGAIPFFTSRSSSSLAQPQADNNAGAGAVVSTYAADVQSGLAFLTRNFAGSNTGTTNPANPGVILPVPEGDPVLPAPAPGSLALVALGGALLAWRTRK